MFGGRYGCLSLIGDCILTMLTGGFWLIFIFVREMRRNSQPTYRRY